jgi:hypothetical protein
MLNHFFNGTTSSKCSNVSQVFVFFIPSIRLKNGKNYHKTCVELKSSCFSWPQIWL